jgi:hypothetical protein
MGVRATKPTAASREESGDIVTPPRMHDRDPEKATYSNVEIFRRWE